MTTTIAVTFLVVGIALVVWGIETPDCPAPPVPPTFAGLPARKPLWLLVGGIASAIAGLVLLP